MEEGTPVAVVATCGTAEETGRYAWIYFYFLKNEKYALQEKYVQFLSYGFWGTMV